MSLLRSAPRYTQSNMHFLMEAVPNPGNRPNLDDAQKQHQVLTKMRTMASDLFTPNAALESDNGEQKTFHSSQMYKMNRSSASAEELVEAMNNYDIVLRCNAVKDGGATAVQIGANDLKEAIASSDKSVTLKAGRNANLKVMLGKKAGLHYIQKLDYTFN